jgi:glycosyltransferase involved in cell wall biosynthesis
VHIAIVSPRYGPEILGGAEALARGFARAAVQRGWETTVWTTCAADYSNWENVYPAGRHEEDGVIVYRFPITQWQPERHNRLSLRFHREYLLPVADQYAWLADGPHSLPLYSHIQRQAKEYDAILALPYLSSLTCYAAWVAPERTILLPCLHNEIYAYIEPFRLLFESVWGLMFLSPEERVLALEKVGIRPRRQAVLGAGIDPLASSPTIDAPAVPYLLYAGRLDEAKNLALLYAYVQQYFDEGSQVQLAITGDGSFKPPKHPAFDWRGFVPAAEKEALIASALAVCQPSLNESFSLVLMESWLAGRPVLVHEKCPVTRGHVQRSQGGLTFASYEEFAVGVNRLQSHPELARQMGEDGRAYVQANYTWTAVLDRFAQIIPQSQDTIIDE